MAKQSEKVDWKHPPSDLQVKLADKIANDPNASGMSKTGLIRSIGYSPSVAQSRTAELFSSQGLRKAFLSMGLTPESLIKTGADALEAQKSTFYQGKLYETDAPDHATRLKGADFIADILGLKKQTIEQQSVNVHVKAEDIEGLI